MDRLEVGTRVEKINSKPGQDTHQDGALATIVTIAGQMPEGHSLAGVWGYFVEWDDIPGIEVFIAGTRIRPVEEAIQ